MARRLGNKERNRIYPYIIQRDGDYCLLCAVYNNRRSPAPPGSTWELDHADSNRNNWRPENIHAVCNGHHQYLSGLSPGEHKKLIMDASIVNMRKRENNKSLSDGLALSIERLEQYKAEGSTEQKARADFEPKWVEIGFSLCYENPEGYPVRAFINDCARGSGCARTTSKNYYETHVLAPKYAEFEQILNNNLERVVILRKNGHNGHRANGHKAVLSATVPVEVKK